MHNDRYNYYVTCKAWARIFYAAEWMRTGRFWSFLMTSLAHALAVLLAAGGYGSFGTMPGDTVLAYKLK